MLLSELQKKQRIAILGYALEGKSTYRFLINQGIPEQKITILDKKENDQIPIGVNNICGPTYMDNLDIYDCIIRTPGITNTIIEDTIGSSSSRLPLISQTELFLSNYTGTIIGITGTKGKSTISMATYLTLKHAKKNVILAGNVGKPILDLIDWQFPPNIVVYELSSFMIESVFTHRQGRTIDIAIFNTLYNTHTKEHGGYENYAHAKALLLHHSDQQLLGYQAKAILDAQFKDIVLPATTRTYGKEGVYRWDGTHFLTNDTPVGNDEGMLLIGTHNRENMCAVLGICNLLAVDLTHLRAVLKTFGGLEHRLELVGTYQAIIRYNDAIATTPQATCAALDSLGSNIDTLFYGGILGEYDHQLVAQKIEAYGIRNLVLFPDTGELLYSLLSEETKSTVHVFHTRSMQDAVQRAATHTLKGKIALLSCGSPSFSVRSGFVEKGNLFKVEIKKLG